MWSEKWIVPLVSFFSQFFHDFNGRHDGDGEGHKAYKSVHPIEGIFGYYDEYDSDQKDGGYFIKKS